jgi:hypothetical protein
VQDGRQRLVGISAVPEHPVRLAGRAEAGVARGPPQDVHREAAVLVELGAQVLPHEGPHLAVEQRVERRHDHQPDGQREHHLDEREAAPHQVSLYRKEEMVVA